MKMQDFNDAPPVLKDFLNYQLVIKGKSKNTVREYYYDLRTFLRFLKSRETYYDDFKKIVITDISEDLIKTVNLSVLYEYLSFVNTEMSNSATARARKVSSLRSFFRYLTEKAEILTINPALELDTPKIKKSLPKYLSLAESKKLLDCIDGENYERDYCIITLFLNCGMRLSELTNINIKDIKEDTIRILGKGNKERTIYLNKSCISAINNYLRVRPHDGVKDPDALFISREKRRISGRMVENIVKKYIKSAGLDTNKYSPHKLRHTAATLLYMYGDVDIRILQEILGHENLNTTEIYTHVENKSIKDAVKKHPLA